MFRDAPRVAEHDFVRTVVLSSQRRQANHVCVTNMEPFVADAAHRRKRKRIGVVGVQRVAVRQLQPIRKVLVVRQRLHVLQVEVELALAVRVELEHRRRLYRHVVHQVDVVAQEAVASERPDRLVHSEFGQLRRNQVAHGKSREEIVPHEVGTRIGVEVEAFVRAAIAQDVIRRPVFVEQRFVEVKVIDHQTDTERKLAFDGALLHGVAVVLGQRDVVGKRHLAPLTVGVTVLIVVEIGAEADIVEDTRTRAQRLRHRGVVHPQPLELAGEHQVRATFGTCHRRVHQIVVEVILVAHNLLLRRETPGKQRSKQ